MQDFQSEISIVGLSIERLLYNGFSLKFDRISEYNLSFADWSLAELAEAMRCILSGQVNNGNNLDQLAIALSKIYSPSTVYPVNYGRSAINIALLAFAGKRPERTDVVVPAYICPSVVQIVRASGLNPVPVDIDNDLNLSLASLGSALSDNTLAVIAPHMYGCPAIIDEIEKLCKRSLAFLIDDAAQVIGVSHQGRILGTFGDVGIISFAQSKSVVTGIGGSGGAILVNNHEFDAEIMAVWKSLPPPSHRLGMFFNFLWNCIWGAHTGNSGYYIARISELIGLRNKLIRVNSRISNLDAGIAIAQLKRIEIIKRNKINNAEAYHGAIKYFKNINFPQYAPGRYLARVMIELPRSADVEVIRSELKNRGVHTRPGYAVHVAPFSDTKNAEEWSRRLLEVPSGKKIGHSEAMDICRMISAAMEVSHFP
jgi:dTDP-4-amino-4,6-dideoxygalactose transaminase